MRGHNEDKLKALRQLIFYALKLYNNNLNIRKNNNQK